MFPSRYRGEKSGELPEFPSEGDECRRWLAESGAWELTDPAVTTRLKGGSPDEIAVRPGRVSPMRLYNAGGADVATAGCETAEYEDFCPVITFPRGVLSDRHPFALGLPFRGALGATRAAGMLVRLHAGNFTQDGRDYRRPLSKTRSPAETLLDCGTPWGRLYWGR